MTTPARAYRRKRVKISTPLAVAAGRLRATLAVAFATGDVALVPLTFADPSLASAAS